MSNLTTRLRAWGKARNDKALAKALSGVDGIGPQQLRDRPSTDTIRPGNSIGSIGRNGQ